MTSCCSNFAFTQYLFLPQHFITVGQKQHLDNLLSYAFKLDYIIKFCQLAPWDSTLYWESGDILAKTVFNYKDSQIFLKKSHLTNYSEILTLKKKEGKSQFQTSNALLKVMCSS